MNSATRILVVEDSRLQAKRLRGLLLENGYDVVVAFDGREGLAAAGEYRPSLIISDIIMPVMDGFSMCRSVRDDKELNTIPIIILTSLSNPEDILRGLEVGADSYVGKPYEERILLSRIKTVMGLPRTDAGEGPERKLQLVLGGTRYLVAANRVQILSLLLSTYEEAVSKNLRLQETRRELMILNQRLEKIVEERTKSLQREITVRKQAETELARQARELSRSNTELQQFAYVVSHDLKEPLRMVASYTQLLGKRYLGRLDSDADDFIDFAVDGVSRMEALIDDLLAYSRLGRAENGLEPADCEAVLATTIANLQGAIRDSGATVTHSPLPRLMCNYTRLCQLFLNLIGNAIKFRGEAPPRVHVAAKRNEKEWVFGIRDNGIGIEPDHAERIFDIFKRLHGRDEYPGTGIGLAICQKIVERHGGRIWVQSKPGAGSTFFFTIPNRRNRQDKLA